MVKLLIDWKILLWVNTFFIIYAFIEIIWMEFLNNNENLINIYTTLGIAMLLILPYTYMNSKVEFGKWYILFLIPVIPYMLYQMLLLPIWYKIFTNPNTSDDLGVGLLSVMIELLHWFSIAISIFLSYVIKGYRTSKILD